MFAAEVVEQVASVASRGYNFSFTTLADDCCLLDVVFFKAKEFPHSRHGSSFRNKFPCVMFWNSCGTFVVFSHLHPSTALDSATAKQSPHNVPARGVPNVVYATVHTHRYYGI